MPWVGIGNERSPKRRQGFVCLRFALTGIVLRPLINHFSKKGRHPAMFNFLLLAGQVALVVILTWKAEEIREACHRLSATHATSRMTQLMNEEFVTGDWRSAYRYAQPSDMTYDRAHGGIGP
jgi:hypothetical protein